MLSKIAIVNDKSRQTFSLLILLRFQYRIAFKRNQELELNSFGFTSRIITNRQLNGFYWNLCDELLTTVPVVSGWRQSLNLDYNLDKFRMTNYS